MSQALDDCTPWWVWREYQRRKLHLPELDARSYCARAEQLADELGCGVPEGELTEGQKRAWDAAWRRWGQR